MDIVLGIDTGGTYTDAVLVDHASGRVLFSAKSLTTYDDLSKGIGRAVDSVLTQPGAPEPGSISMVGLSTTLATNAIVEGRGGRVCLILIGYDQDLIDSYDLKRELVVRDVVHLAGGHDSFGEEVRPLDEEGLREALLSRRDKVDAFGVSSYFGVRNPEHETRAKTIIESLTGLPVTCGHMLTSRLDSIRRATTVALNAGLIPLIKDLINSVQEVLTKRRVSGQLMVVKGDGSLAEASWAAQRPIETILSGPAASVIGARHLVEENEDGDFWVMDMGGTTTDIAQLKGGQPRLNKKGARVGCWQTMVEAVDIQTVGLGGDSLVKVRDGGSLELGPERVIPLCLTAVDHPAIIAELKKQRWLKGRSPLSALFLTSLAPCKRKPDSAWESDLLSRLAKGPVAWETLIREGGPASYLPGPVKQAAAKHLIGISGFTPTDALHVLGEFMLWSAEASIAAATVLARKAGLEPQEFARQVIEKVHFGGAKALVRTALAGEGFESGFGKETIDSVLMERALSGDGKSDGNISVAMTLKHPVAAIGAPVGAYGPAIAQKLGTKLLIPAKAEVANAVGAVVGGVIIRHSVLIKPLGSRERYRVHLPEAVLDFEDKEEAVRHALEIMKTWMEESAQRAGAEHPEVSLVRREIEVPVQGGKGETLYLGTELIYTAVGRPSPALKES